jgi:hypothetical protein
MLQIGARAVSNPSGFIRRKGALGQRTFRALDIRACDPSVSLESRALWRIIDSHANRFGEGAFPSVSTLCKLAGRDRKSIFRYISELEAAGWLARTHAKGKSNSYILIYPPVPKIGMGRHKKAVPKNGTTTSPQNGDTNQYPLTNQDAPRMNGHRVDFSEVERAEFGL